MTASPDRTPRLDYELLDFGAGRRLERFGTRTVDRPAPAASDAVLHKPTAWPAATLRWERDGDGWVHAAGAADPWVVEAGPFRLELRPTSSGQLGCYPEHVAVWRILAEVVERDWRVLNLFAHTGGATLAAAAAGAAVTHVDAARTAVAWARRNAALSDLAAAPVRWIVDDAVSFAARELRRGRRYEAVIVDPPAYGHGPGERRWQIATDLPWLLQTVIALGGPGGPRVLVLTTHATGAEAADAAAIVAAAWPGLARQRLAGIALDLPATDGRRLAAGVAAVVRP